MDSSKKFIKPSPEAGANTCSKLFYCWVLPLLKFGYKNDLRVKDIYNTTKVDFSGTLGDQLEKNWQNEVKRCSKGSNRKPSLQRAILKTFFKSYFLYGIWLFLQCVILRMLLPIVLAAYIHYFDVSSRDKGPEEGWLLGAGLVLIAFFNILIMHACSLGCQRVGMRVRIACCSLIYRKLLKLSQSSLGQTAAGQLVNLLSNDVQRFDLASVFLHFAWIMPIQSVLAFYVMYRSVGISAIAGMLAIAIQAIPLQGYLSKLQGKLRYKIALRTDHRVKLMSEITSGIQVIKMYAWEKPFEKIVELARKLEIDVVTQTSYIKGVSVAMMVFTERVTLYLTLVMYVLMGNKLTGDVVFSMAQLFNTVQLYMSIFFPMSIATYAEARVSIKRIEQFLTMEENAERRLTITENSIKADNVGEIRLVNAGASWIPNPIVDTLIGINLEIKPGTLCCVVGSVGAGKSSFLQLLLKELPVSSGKVTVAGTISYASQEPWLFVSSVRNNILFGKPYLKNRYKDIVRVCALQQDFEQFPQQDQTLVGERGVSLSGGQRARINLARAIYAEADIYLLDDPLSAVDTHVGKHLFEHCIKKYLNKRTRILVTHQLQFLKRADLIVVLNNGRIEKVASYNELSENELNTLSQEQNQEEKEKSPIGENRDRLQSIASFGSSIINEDEPQETDELIEKGDIATSTYAEYCKAGGTWVVLLSLVLLLLIAQIAVNASDLWLTHWTNDEEKAEKLYKNNSLQTGSNVSSDVPDGNATFVEEIPDLSRNTSDTRLIDNLYTDGSESRGHYILIYTIFIVASIILLTCRSLLYYKVCMTASKVLHNKMFANVLQAPMRFFDTNPSGRILNRFSKDMGALDELLPRAALDAIQIFLVMSGILVMNFIVTPWMIIPAVILGVLFYYFRVVYLATAQDVKRLEGVARAPVFSHVSASLYGMPTIRSSNAENMVIKEFDILQDQHTSTWVSFLAASETFGFYLDLISTAFLAMVTFQFLIFKDERTLSGNVGLVISQSLILTGMLQFGVRQTAEVASNMVSVERVLQYTKLEKEGPFETMPGKKPPRTWPHSGAITFKSTSLRYAADQQHVLRNLNIEIRPTEKIGIVGRTGAGKSSLIASLFRLAPIEGVIEIDGVDTSAVGLNDLRSSISIIPQEPILFSASIRYNLDPFEKHSDETLWKALENVELKGVIEDLNKQVSESGSNFSAGQRQLICLARAIVRDNKILVMDEATANVDPNTDALIQRTIREAFKDCTVLTIAHRLNTVMDSDKVLVMDCGQAVEFAHPHQLLQDAAGFFTRMVKETGSLEEKLRRVSKEDYEKKHVVQSHDVDEKNRETDRKDRDENNDAGKGSEGSN